MQYLPEYSTGNMNRACIRLAQRRFLTKGFLTEKKKKRSIYVQTVLIVT